MNKMELTIGIVLLGIICGYVVGRSIKPIEKKQSEIEEATPAPRFTFTNVKPQILSPNTPYSHGIYQTSIEDLENWKLTRNHTALLRSKKMDTIYLTFDSGSLANAEEILNVLEEENVTATFFLQNCRYYTHRRGGLYNMQMTNLIRRIARIGVCGNHTVSHYDLKHMRRGSDHDKKLNPEQLPYELFGIEKMFSMVTGKTLEKIWRAPYLSYTTNLISLMESAGYIHVYCSLDSIDWICFTKNDWDRGYRKLKKVKGGDIVLFHLGLNFVKSPEHVKMVEWFIKLCKKKGYGFDAIRRKDIF